MVRVQDYVEELRDQGEDLLATGLGPARKPCKNETTVKETNQMPKVPGCVGLGISCDDEICASVAAKKHNDGNLASAINDKAANLANMPPEILAIICGKLEAIWLYNMSHVSSSLYKKMNGPGANKMWYDAMPESIWAKRERFQDADEIVKWARELKVKNKEYLGMDILNFRRQLGSAPPALEASIEFDRTPRSLHRPGRPALRVDTSIAKESDESLSASVVSSSRSSTGDEEELSLIDTPPTTDDAPQTPAKRSRITSGSTGLSSEVAKTGDAVVQTTGLSPVLANAHLVCIPVTSPVAAQGSDGDGQKEVVRRKVNALAGPFQPLFSYKREIMGRIKSELRCYICLNYRYFPDKAPVTRRAWGMLWCAACVNLWSIPLYSIERLVDFINMKLNVISRYPYRQHQRKMVEGNQLRYFVPEVNAFFFALKMGDIDSLTLHREVLMAKTAWHRMVCQRNRDYRMRVRRMIVAAAEQIWEGHDPSPDRWIDSQTGMVHYVSRAHINPGRFACFRKRFAPTYKLHTFLFPPEATSYDIGPPTCREEVNIYLADPVPLDIEKVTRQWTGARWPDSKWLSDRAEEMLEALTDFQAPRYNSKGRGGNVTPWTRAANDYHFRRLEKSITKGEVVSQLRPWNAKRDSMQQTLREKLDFDEIARTFLRISSERLHLRIHTEPLRHYLNRDPEKAVRDEMFLKGWEHMRAEKVAAFNKIIRVNAKRCPETGLMLSQKGLQAVLDHVRVAHPYLYWQNNEWGLVG